VLGSGSSCSVVCSAPGPGVGLPLPGVPGSAALALCGACGVPGSAAGVPALLPGVPGALTSRDSTRCSSGVAAAPPLPSGRGGPGRCSRRAGPSCATATSSRHTT
jgi:hypothetical protein